MAERLPCGEVESVLDVCGIACVTIGVEPPPKYSGRWTLASGLLTPKCDRITSIYLVPPRASRSSNF